MENATGLGLCNPKMDGGNRRHPILSERKIRVRNDAPSESYLYRINDNSGDVDLDPSVYLTIRIRWIAPNGSGMELRLLPQWRSLGIKFDEVKETDYKVNLEGIVFDVTWLWNDSLSL